ncbi:MAG TPA: AI-2E family transporter [Bacteroidota bacterium]|nr:AI-2E family transporter [Bacteroidota bacterium]
MSRIFRTRQWKVFVVTFSITAPILLLSFFGQVFLLLTLSLTLTMVLKPVVNILEHKGMPRPAAILSLFVLLGGIAVFGLVTLYPIVVFQASNLSASFDSAHLSTMVNRLSESISRQAPFLKPGAINARIEILLSNAGQSAEGLAAGLLSVAASLIIVPFITFFLLNDYYRMQKALIENVPNKYFEMALNVIDKLEDQVSRFIRGTCIESMIVAVLYTIAYNIIGVQYAIVLGLIGGIMNVIPFAGPFIAALPVVAVSVVQYGDLSMIIPIIISTIIVQQVDQFFVQPAVFSKLMSIHPLIMFLVILVGGGALGVMGMVLSIPIYTIIVVTARETNWGLKSYRITE